MPTISSITHSENSKRKSHRITIPIQIIIYGHTYAVHNWSMDGLGVALNPQDFKEELIVDKVLYVSLVLPTGGSSILLDMEVIIKNISSNMYSMQIGKINDKNRRVLRHYATLAIDGNINHIDNLSCDLFMANVPSPIKESILMSDKESQTIHKSFLKKLFIKGFVGFLFLAILIVVVLYNYIIVKESLGLISGNSSVYFAPYDGVIKDIYVKKGDYIEKNQSLFAMEDKDYRSQQKILQKAQTTFQKQFKTYKNRLKIYQQYSDGKLTEMKLLTKNSVQRIKENLQTQKETYKRAEYLYKNQLLSFSQFSDIQSRYFQYLDDYNAVINEKRSINKNSLTLEQSYNNNQDHIISIQNTMVSLSKEIDANRLEITQLNNKINSAVIVSNSAGKIYNIHRKEGDLLHYADNVLIVETNEKPFVLVKILSSEMSSITINAPCIIKSSTTGKIYTAKITGIGYPAIDGVNVGGNELSQSNVALKIEFNNDSVRFKLNEYVQVYILNNSPITESLVKITTGISLDD